MKIKVFLLNILVILFIILSILVIRDYAQNFDRIVASYIQSFEMPMLTKIMKLISNLGDWFVYFPIVLIFLIMPRSRINVGIPAGMVLVSSAVLNEILKNSFSVARPQVYRLTDVKGYSFPSGHAMTGTAFVGACAYMFLKSSYKKPIKIIVFTIAIAFVIAIGFSRIYLGVHSPTDVIAGYLCGLIVLIVSIMILQYRENKICKK